MNKTANRRKELIETTNHDDGKAFIPEESQRLSVIRGQLAGSSYVETKLPLVSLFSKKNPLEMTGKVTVLSSHIDTVDEITEPYWDEEAYRGTLDNGITNHVCVELMLADLLPDNVIVAFTGNEEYGCRGAEKTAVFLEKKCPDVKPRYITLDVSEYAKDYENCDVRVEYRKDKKKLAKKIRKKLADATYRIEYGAMAKTYDETDTYRNYGKAVSVCIPVDEGSFFYHSNTGVGIKPESLAAYSKALADIAKFLS